MSALARMVVLVTPYAFSEPHRFWGNLHSWNLIFFSRFFSHFELILDASCYVKSYIDLYLSILRTNMLNTSMSKVKLMENRTWLTRVNNYLGRTITPFYIERARKENNTKEPSDWSAYWRIYINRASKPTFCSPRKRHFEAVLNHVCCVRSAYSYSQSPHISDLSVCPIALAKPFVNAKFRKSLVTPSLASEHGACKSLSLSLSVVFPSARFMLLGRLAVKTLVVCVHTQSWLYLSLDWMTCRLGGRIEKTLFTSFQ